jgi:hypothetical protein
MFHLWAHGEEWTINVTIGMRHLSFDYKAVFGELDIYWCFLNYLKRLVYCMLYKIRFPI